MFDDSYNAETEQTSLFTTTHAPKSARLHTQPKPFKHTVENEIQVEAGVFIFFYSQQGLWGVEKVKTRLGAQTHTHLKT